MRNRFRTERRLGIFLALALGSSAAPSNAQESGEPGTARPANDAVEDPVHVLEEITVVGEKRARSRQATSTSVRIYRFDELEDGTDSDLYELLDRTPNATSNFGGRGFSIRGVENFGITTGAEPLAGTYLDGAVQSGLATVYGPRSLWDVEQVEILRGPQSTTQGRNALAGALIVRTKDPTYHPSAHGRASYGRFTDYQAAAAVSGPLLEDQLALRLSVDQRGRRGSIRNATLGDDGWNSLDNRTLRGKLLWEPEGLPGLSVRATVIHSDNEFGDGLLPRDDPFAREALDDERARTRNDNAQFILETRFEPTDAMTLTSLTTYGLNDFDRVRDFDGTAVALLVDTFEESDDILTQEFRLNYDDERWSAVTGVYFYAADKRQDFALFAGDAVRELLPFLPPITLTRQETAREVLNLAWFGEASARITDHWELTASLRVDYETVDERFDAVTLAPFDALIPGLRTAGSDEEGFVVLLPKVGVTYHFDEDLSLGATIQRGYRTGGLSINPISGRVEPFDPEFIWSYEIAFRSRWWRRRLTLNANVFYVDWRDQQVIAEVADVTVNAGKSRLYGLEIEATSRPFDGVNLELFAGLGLLETEFRDFETGGEDFSGNEFPKAPNVTATVGATYRHPIGLFAGFDVAYTGESFATGANDRDEIIDDRWLANAKIGYEHDFWSLYFYGRNLFDQDYITGYNSPIPTVRVGEPAEFGAVVEVYY